LAYDNLEAAVVRMLGGGERALTARFSALASPRLRLNAGRVEAVPGRPYAVVSGIDDHHRGRRPADASMN
jgi:hypothetical protein